MSVRAMTRVFEADLDDQQFRALIAMADHADDDGGSIFPSIDWLAWKIGKSERQTQRIVKALRMAGYIELVRPARRTRPNEYKLVYAALPPKAEFKRGLNDMPPGMREAVIAEGDHTCAICGQRGEGERGPDGQPWNVDRIVPAVDGGRYEWGNVRLACGTCNRSRDHRRDRGATDGTPESAGYGTPGGVPSRRHPGGATQVAPEPSVEPSTTPANAGVASRESDPDAIVLCRLLASLMRENDPRAKLPKDGTAAREEWLRQMRLLVGDRQGDGPDRVSREHAAAEVAFVIRWCQADDFERANVRSPGKLRQRFSELKLKADRQSARGQHLAAASPDPLAGLSPEQRARAIRTQQRMARAQTNPNPIGGTDHGELPARPEGPAGPAVEGPDQAPQPALASA